LPAGDRTTGARPHGDRDRAQPGKLTNRPGLEIKQGDATNPSILVPLITGHDAVVSASRFVTSDPAALIAAVTKTGVKLRHRVRRRARTSETSPPALHGGLLSELTATRCHAAGAS